MLKNIKVKSNEVFHFFIILSCIINRNVSIASDVYMGGIFESSNEDAKLVFEVAIDWVNNHHDLIGNHLKSMTVTIEQDKVYNKSHGFVADVTWNKPITTVLAGCSLLSNGVATIFSHLSEDNSNAIQSLCDNKEIPIIQILGHQQYESECCSINMHPYIPELSKAFADLVKEWNWNSFTILYEEDQNLEIYAGLLKINSKPGKNVVMRQFRRNYNGDYMDALKNIRRSAQTNFVLDFSIANLVDILREIQKVGMMMSDYSYIILNLDLYTIDLSSYQHSATNITGFRLIDTSNPKLKEIEDLIQIKQSARKESTHQRTSNYKLENSLALLIDAVTLSTLVIKDYGKLNTRPLYCNSSASWEYGSTIFNYMKIKSFNGLTGKVEFNHQGFRTQFVVDVIKLTENGIDNIGKWSSTEGLLMSSLSVDLETAHENLSNRTFKVMVCWIQPYAMLKTTSEKLTGNDQFEGFAIDLIHELSILEGFKYKFIRNEDDQNGSYNSTSGKWNGMINDILTEKGDLAIGDLTITKDRQNAVDFTEPFMSLGVQILYRKPTTSSPAFFSFASPFTSEVWLLFMVTFFLMSFMLYVTARLCPSEWTNPYPCIENPEYLVNTYNFGNCVWLIIANLMQEGADYGPRGLSTRILTSFWSFFILIMISSYTANMAAFLTAEKEDWAFTDINQLVNNSKKLGIVYGAVSTGATFKLFKETEDEIFKTAFDYMQTHPEAMVEYFDDGVQKVFNGAENYAFFMESSSIKYVTNRRCNLTAVGKRLDEKYYAIAMKKGSPYRYKLSAAIVKLKQSGKIDELERKWWEREHIKEPCLKKSEMGAAPPLNYKHVAGIIWITLGGTVLACALVVIELLLKVTKLHPRNQRQAALKEELRFYCNFEKMVKPNEL